MKIIYISKRYLYMIALFLLISIIFFIIQYNRHHITEAMYLPINNKIIGIDPGHGGVDPGAVSKTGVKEDDINLEIVLKLKRFIEQSGGIPIMTRETDRGLYTSKSKTLREMKTEDLYNRKKLIEDANCELFVSIHLNSFTRERYYGAQTFYNKDSEISYRLATIIQEEFKNILDRDNRREPVARDDIFLIRELDMPTVLVECGFLSNNMEEKLLQSEEYQEKIAWSIYVGIMRYFSEIEND